MIRPPLRRSLTLLLGAALLAAAQAQSVHKCVGPDGRTNFTDAPCAVDEKSTPVKLRDNAIEGSGLPPRDTVQRLDGGAAPNPPPPPVPGGAIRIGPNQGATCSAFDRFARAQNIRTLDGSGYASYMDLARACDAERASEGDASAPSCEQVRKELQRHIDPARGEPVPIAALLAAQNGCRTDELKRTARDNRLSREARDAQLQRDAARRPRQIERVPLTQPEIPPLIRAPGR